MSRRRWKPPKWRYVFDDEVPMWGEGPSLTKARRDLERSLEHLYCDLWESRHHMSQHLMDMLETLHRRWLA